MSEGLAHECKHNAVVALVALLHLRHLLETGRRLVRHLSKIRLVPAGFLGADPGTLACFQKQARGTHDALSDVVISRLPDPAIHEAVAVRHDH